MNKRVRWLSSRSVEIAGILALSGLIGCQEEVEQVAVVRPVKTIVLGESTQSRGRVFPGIMQAARRARLSFRVSGPLVELAVNRGDQVRRGDLLAQIDPRDFDTRVKNLEARLANLRAQRRAMESARPEDILREEAHLAAAEARLLEANATFRRYQRLYQDDNVSKAEYDQRRAARDVAVADARASGESLRIARTGAREEDVDAMDAQVRALEAELLQATDDLRDTALVAPYDGIVADSFVENFEYVAGQQEIISLQDISMVEIAAQIPEAIVAEARGGRIPDFFVRFGALPDQEFPTEVEEFSAEADPVTRTYSVTFRTPQPEEANILAGMTAEIVLSGLGDADAAFSVPVAAIFTDDGGRQSVWVVDKASMMPRKVNVTVGDLVGESAMILDGVSNGDQIITAGARYLSEDQKIREVTDELRERR